ncbi:MAG: IS200/IS605 family transposase [Chloroflexi bacterium]|nr:IS200/IS605 family transposase [Chloroflexota bacterium]
MTINVLIADPNTAFATMIQQVLEETTRFKVTVVGSGADAVNAFSKGDYDLAVMEAMLEDFSLRDIVAVLRARQSSLPIMVIQAPGVDAAGLDLQGLLTRPFYIPELQGLIEDALRQPVNGITPRPRPKTGPLPPMGGGQESAAPAAPNIAPTPITRRASPPPPAPAWLDDVSRAAQYLTSLTLESSAAAALLMRGRQLIAYAGQFDQERAEELSRIVADYWAKDASPGQAAQARFIRLSSGADYLVYSTMAAAEVVLSMAFQAETPLSMIRKQAKRATEALFKSPGSEEATPVVETEQIEPARRARPPAISPVPEWATAASTLPPPPQPTPDSTRSVASRFTSSPTVDAFALQPVPFPDVRRTPHGLFALSYTFLFIPKLPSIQLTDELKEQLEDTIKRQAAAHDWRVASLSVEATHVEVSLDCAPSESPEGVIKTIIERTSEKVLAEFPRLAEEHARRPGSLWAGGYYVVVPGRKLSAEEIKRFIDYQRKEQSGK